MTVTATFIQPGEKLTLNAPYDRSAGQPAMVGSIFGVALQDVLSGVDGEFAVTGVWDLPKTDSQAWSVGDKIYWKASTKACTTVATDGPLIGVAVEALGSGSGITLGQVKLTGVPPDTAEGPQAAIASLTGTPSGTANGALEAEGTLSTSDTYSDAAVNTVLSKIENNIAELATVQESILVALRAAGIIASS